MELLSWIVSAISVFIIIGTLIEASEKGMANLSRKEEIKAGFALVALFLIFFIWG